MKDNVTESEETSLSNLILDSRPDIRPAVDRQMLKASTAQMLRELRKSAKLTQVQVAERSGLDQAVISRMESPHGALPALDTFSKFVAACNGHMFMGVSQSEVPAHSIETALAKSADQPIFAMAV